MQLNQIEAFVAVAKLSSFTKAAKTLYLSQPTISTHITSLEAELNVQLIVRSTKGVSLSKAGVIFYKHAVQILKAVDCAVMSLKDFASETKGALEIAASTVPAQYIIPLFLSKLRDEFPQLFFTIKQFDSAEVVNQILSLDCEVGITGTIVESKCVYEEFVKDRLVVITPNKEKYSCLNGIFDVKLLKTEPFLLREEGSGTRKETEIFFNSLDIDIKKMNIAAQMYGTESIKQAVAGGVGISIISKVAAADFEKFGKILTFDLNSPYLDRSFYLVYLKNVLLSPAATAFIKFVKNLYNTNTT